MQGDREERIRQRAYDIWEREGKPAGRDEAHWAQACAEIDAERDTAPEDENVGVVTKVVRRTRKAAAQALDAGLHAVVDVVEEALSSKKPRARKAKDEGKPADTAADTSEDADKAPAKGAAKGMAKKANLPVVETRTRAVAKTEEPVKPARGKAAKAPADESPTDKSAAMGKPAGKPRRKSAASTEAAP